MNILLYVLTVLIWGTTWIAIKLQLGEVAVEASVIYRFCLAGMVLFAALLLSRRLQPMSGRDHLFCLLQGGCLFSLNFYCFYLATGYIASGLASVVFSLATVFNAVNQRLFFGESPRRATVVGSLLGVLGIVALFRGDLQNSPADSGSWWGFALAAFGTLLFSLGNMLSLRHQRCGLRPPTTNAWGIIYGVLIMTLIAVLKGVSFGFSERPEYLASLIYLAVPGTVIAFTCYLLLVGRIGADRAAYTTVLFPVVALTISTWVEGYQWGISSVIGFGLVLAGNLVIFGRYRKVPASRPHREGGRA